MNHTVNTRNLLAKIFSIQDEVKWKSIHHPETILPLPFPGDVLGNTYLLYDHSNGAQFE
jgi:hypothetical protein